MSMIRRIVPVLLIAVLALAVPQRAQATDGHFLFGVGAYIASRIRRYLPPDASIAFVVAVFFCSSTIRGHRMSQAMKETE